MYSINYIKYKWYIINTEGVIRMDFYIMTYSPAMLLQVTHLVYK